MFVQQILKNKPPGVVTVAPGTTLRQAVEVLAARRIGAVVVSPDGQKVNGIVSERDIVRELALRGPSCLDEPVERVMTRAIYTCTPEDSADRVLEMMTQRRFRHMPVMKGGIMIGLISIGDVVAARLAELQMERDALTQMISGS